ncbi:MAG TPA: Gfo/Idh/MocA family oxidoreductase, partial [Clostridia bacterium]|nr:Gfo/Idh/MocA family oxidoreductase [Clostridia bacterium]
MDEGYNSDMALVYSKEPNEFESMFGREISHFIDCVKGRSQCISPVEDGVELMRILDAVYESASTGREVRL